MEFRWYGGLITHQQSNSNCHELKWFHIDARWCHLSTHFGAVIDWVMSSALLNALPTIGQLLFEF